MGKGSQVNQRPCPTCGKYKKYKHCCLEIDRIKKREVPPKVLEYFKKKEMERRVMQEMGIYVDYVSPIIYKGQKVWALGNQIYFNNNIHQTFHEFILEILFQNLSKEWLDSEQAKGERNRHFIVKCANKYWRWKAANSLNPTNKVEEHLWIGKPDGWSRSLMSIAFDICSLVHTNQLPIKIMERLKNPDQYQGARYEIAVAAIFARLGCNIKFLDEDENLNTDKHCEFIATHKATGISIAIEAKSRHRQGVIHQAGTLNEEEALKANIGQLLNKALAQNPNNMPFMIFIDLNSPMTPNTEIQNKQWFKDIRKTLGKGLAPTPEKPDPFNAVIFTNYSYHYQTENEANPGEHVAVIPMYTTFPLPNANFTDMLLSALNHYGNVPNIDIDKDND